LKIETLNSVNPQINKTATDAQMNIYKALIICVSVANIFIFI